MTSLPDRLTQALDQGKLLASAKSNIEALLAGSSDPLVPAAIEELAA